MYLLWPRLTLYKAMWSNIKAQSPQELLQNQIWYHFVQYGMRKTHKPPDLGSPSPPLPIPPEEPEVISDYIFAIHLYLSEQEKSSLPAGEGFPPSPLPGWAELGLDSAVPARTPQIPLKLHGNGFIESQDYLGWKAPQSSNHSGPLLPQPSTRPGCYKPCPTWPQKPSPPKNPFLKGIEAINTCFSFSALGWRDGSHTSLTWLQLLLPQSPSGRCRQGAQLWWWLWIPLEWFVLPPELAWGQQWQLWELTPEVLHLDTPCEAEQHPRTAHLPPKHTIPAEIWDLLLQTCYRSHFIFPNLPHVHFSLQTRNRVKQTSVGVERGWWKVGVKSGDGKGWRTKHCCFLCRKWKGLVTEEQTEDSQMLKRWICKQKNKKGEIHNWEFQ